MLNSYFEALILLSYPLLVLFIAFYFTSSFWEKVFLRLHFKRYQNIQRVHKNEVSRLGGLFIYIFFVSLVWLELIQQKIFVNIIISALPLVLIALKEDVFHNTSPRSRLILMVISCFIFFFLNPIDFPLIDFPFFGNLISLYPIGIIFFTFSLLVVMNGMNLIDGMNGLFGYTALSQLVSVIFLSNYVNDFDVMIICIFLSLPLIIFILFNYPFGKIFAGDLGAYFYGFANSIMVIYFFGKNDNLLTWLAVIIVFYPSIELLFSFVRKKLIENKSPLMPDANHLHSLIFLKSSFKDIKHKNNKVIMFIFPLVFCPLISLYLINSIILIFITLVFLIIFYISLYFYMLRSD